MLFNLDEAADSIFKPPSEEEAEDREAEYDSMIEDKLSFIKENFVDAVTADSSILEEAYVYIFGVDPIFYVVDHLDELGHEDIEELYDDIQELYDHD
jgi:hypothetical protein